MKIMVCQKYTNNSGQKNVARSVAVVAVRLWGVQRIWFSLPAAVQIGRSGGEALFCPVPSARAPISAAGFGRLDKLLVAAGAFPVGHCFVEDDVASAQDYIAFFKFFKELVGGKTVGDFDNFASALRAFGGMAAYSDSLLFLHSNVFLDCW